MTTYTARDLKDIAAQFDRRGDTAELRGKLAITRIAKRADEAEMRAWREAADILRNTPPA